ncbi:hypothetical protein HN51_036571 [Arachis hypogaea]|uniref:Legume lectin domain-containing protein n=1 Tax=Arachis hypogaea TaxID=3818 RepID=A0A444ZZD5_ARAHY|nr:uncharacterized protein LOC112735197 [Arachis hypogaea]QHO01961.1 uncharacterized protein DS421_13g419720 [Arachis hypogaea]RYR19533.1 hypothetical protein Ahy_B03g064335 isoform B [Arachis hypogaea]
MGSFISFLIFTLCCSSSFSLVHSFDNTASDSLNSLVQDFALRSFIKHRHRHQTGAVYDALLPRNLSGMNASVVRLRSRRLWSKGANFGYFRIPPKTASIPHVKRLAIVYQDFGNWSSRYYNLSGYSLASSVVGFMVFDASNVTDTNVRNLTLNTMGKPISVIFPNVTFMGGVISRARCVAFLSNGTFHLTEMGSHGVCYSREQGHFSIVLPLEKKKRPWYLWLIGFVVGFFGLIAVVYVGVLCLRLVKAKRIQDMERQANEDLVLESRWVGNSKMPSAAVTRTQPVLESGVQ